MSLIWGVTWIATKAGVAAVPPFFFGAARYVLVSAVLVFVVRDLRAVFGGGRALRLDRHRHAGGRRDLWVHLLGHAVRRLGRFGRRQHVDESRCACSGSRSCSGRSGRHGATALALVLGVGGLVLLFSGKASYDRQHDGVVGRRRAGRGIARLLRSARCCRARCSIRSRRCN